jgi:hypothetical protein
MLKAKEQQVERKLEEAPTQEVSIALEAEIATIKQVLTQLSATANTTVAPVPAMVMPNMEAPRVLRQVNIDCPYEDCEANNTISMLDRAGETREELCTFCARRYNVHGLGDGKYIAKGINLNPGYERTADYLSPTGFDFQSNEAGFVFTNVAELLTATPNTLTVNDLIEAITGRIDLLGIATTKTRVRKILQLVYWGKGFSFVTTPGFNSPINGTVPLRALRLAYVRAIGFRFIEAGYFIHEIQLRTDLKAYFPDATDVEIDEMVNAYRNP